MKTLGTFLSDLFSLRVRIWADGERLMYAAPKGVLTEELKEGLRERKAKIVALLANHAFAREAAQKTIRQVSRQQNLPLSFAQQRLWFLEKLEGAGTTYNIPTPLRLTGRLSVLSLEKSMRGTVTRHESLRTCFPESEGKPVQSIPNSRVPFLGVVDLSHPPAVLREAEVERLIDGEALFEFDLARGPLFRSALLRMEPDHHLLLLNMHHIVSDGWSMGILVQELSEQYKAFAGGRTPVLPELPIQYADFAYWQRSYLTGSTLDAQMTFWKSGLGTGLPVLSLPTDRPRPRVLTYRGSKEIVVITNPLADRLRNFAKGEGVSLAMVLLSVYCLLLGRHSGQDDIVVGIPNAGRIHKGVENLIGYFINMLVLRNHLSGRPSFRELLGRVRKTSLAAYDHQELPFEKLVEELQPVRDRSRNPLFQVFFNMLNLPSGDVDLPQLKLEAINAPDVGSKFDMTLYALDKPDGLALFLHYNRDLFDRERVRVFLEQYEHLLAGVLERPELRIDDFSLRTPGSRDAMPDPTRAFAAERTESVLHAFARQAARFPQKVALSGSSQAVTYQELDVLSRDLAERLKKEGIGPGAFVSVYGGRGASLVWAVLGILRAGAAFAILDPAYPAARLVAQLEVARPQGWIRLEGGGELPRVLKEYVEREPFLSRLCLPRRLLDSTLKGTGAEAGSPPFTDTDRPAYLLFTSGTTGEPKAIAGSLGPLSHFIQWYARRFDLNENDRFSMLSGLGHDPILRDILAPLTLGATLCIPESEPAANAGELVQWFAERVITLTHLTPALGRLLIAFANAPDRKTTTLSALRLIFFGGDRLLHSDVWQMWRHAPRAQCVNFYGASETPQAMSWFTVSRAEKPLSLEPAMEVPIGRGIDGVQLLILNGRNLAGIGELGEIAVRTAHLSLGYLNDAALTAKRFIANPFGEHAEDRIYLTGDLGRYLPNGDIAFAGRRDGQVQMRGFRIETGEVAGWLCRHDAIREAFVTPRQDLQSLAAYLVCEGRAQKARQAEQGTLPAALAVFLGERLPAHMIPSSFTFLDKLPLSPNGKVDVAALPDPEPAAVDAKAFVPPQTPEQELIASTWCEVLGLQRVSIQQNFFEAGGHSLLATLVVSRLSEAFAREIPLSFIFEASTVARLQARIEEALLEGGRVRLPPIVPVGREHPIPLSFAQRRLLLLHEIQGDSTAYHMPFGILIQGSLCVSALERAIDGILARHEVLRTTFSLLGDQPVQVIHAHRSWSLAVVDPGTIPASERDDWVRHWAEADARRPFDLEKGPLLRATLLRRAGHAYSLLFNMHHIVSDGWSVGLITSELSSLYRAFVREEPAPLAPLAVQYADFAVWQQRWMKGEAFEAELAYWRGKLGGAPTVGQLPGAFPAPETATNRAGHAFFQLTQELTGALNGLCRRGGVTQFMLLLAAFKALVFCHTGEDDLVVGTDVANRNRVEIEGLIGFFINQLVLRTQLSGNPDFTTLLKRVRTTTLEAYTHQDMPFDTLVRVLNPERELGRAPLFQMKLVNQNAPAGKLSLPGLEFDRLPILSQNAKFDLLVNLSRADTQLAGWIEFNRDFYDKPTITGLWKQFEMILQHIVHRPESNLSELKSMLARAEAEEEEVALDNLDAARLSKLRGIKRRKGSGT